MSCFIFFFFNDTATTEIYTLSLHDALPISQPRIVELLEAVQGTTASLYFVPDVFGISIIQGDRKSTRLNSSHVRISYAVFCLKKKNDRTPLNPCPLQLTPPSLPTTHSLCYT